MSIGVESSVMLLFFAFDLTGIFDVEKIDSKILQILNHTTVNPTPISYECFFNKKFLREKFHKLLKCSCWWEVVLKYFEHRENIFQGANEKFSGL